jgi:septal ring factor EnvC (AmiA/AmiB activator)
MLKEIAQTENILSDVRKNREESLYVLTLMDKKIATRNNLITNISKDITNVDAIISDLEAQINLLNAEILNLKKEYGRVIWISYLNRHKLNQLMYIFSAEDFNQAYRRLKYLKQYSEYRKRQIRAIESVQTDLGKKLVELDKQKSEKSKLLAKAEMENKALSKELDEKTRIVNNLKKREKELISKLNEKNKIAVRLKNEIERLIRKEIEENNARIAREKADRAAKNRLARNKKTNKSANRGTKNDDATAPVISLTPGDATLSSGFKENKGKLPWPTEKGVITDFFGERKHPIYKGVILRNNGIDITTTEGAMVRSVFDGEVRCVIPILGANYSILVKHGNYYTVYTNIVDVKVKTGEKVKTKQVLGKVFTDYLSNATVLHIEVWENLNRLDPQLWLNKN